MRFLFTIVGITALAACGAPKAEPDQPADSLPAECAGMDEIECATAKANKVTRDRAREEYAEAYQDIMEQ